MGVRVSGTPHIYTLIECIKSIKIATCYSSASYKGKVTKIPPKRHQNPPKTSPKSPQLPPRQAQIIYNVYKVFARYFRHFNHRKNQAHLNLVLLLLLVGILVIIR
jgi:hypothetical protein